MLASASQEAWETLKASYVMQSTSRVMQLRTTLSKCKKLLDKMSTVYFNEVKALSDQLASIGQPLSVMDFNSYLLVGLDSDCDALADCVGARQPRTRCQSAMCLHSS
jgi:hypothetical protein